MSRQVPSITAQEVALAHQELDALSNALGENDAEATWWLIMDRVAQLPHDMMKQHLAMLLVLSLQRNKELLNERNSRLTRS